MANKKRGSYVMISVVSERYDIHPQTLRLYEREGLIEPPRSKGNTRRYDDSTLKRLESILTLTRDMGVNLAGVEVILRLQDELARVRRERDEARAQLRRQAAGDEGQAQRRHALVRVTGGPLVAVPLDNDSTD